MKRSPLIHLVATGLAALLLNVPAISALAASTSQATFGMSSDSTFAGALQSQSDTVQTLVDSVQPSAKTVQPSAIAVQQSTQALVQPSDTVQPSAKTDQAKTVQTDRVNQPAEVTIPVLEIANLNTITFNTTSLMAQAETRQSAAKSTASTQAESTATAPLTPAPKFIESGEFHSVLPEVEGEPHQIAPFYMDETAVTNRQYSAFLEANPEWQPGEVTALYADNGYLRHWPRSETTDPGSGVDTGSATTDSGSGVDPDVADQPVTRVSWFAANSYCGWAGGRLPTLNEWEYAAQAMDFESPAEADRFSSELIGWYSSVDALRAEKVGSTGIENRYGVKDLFGLIMEWVEDFKPPMASGMSLDCGTMGRMSGDPSIYTYAMSIRYITRMSFQPTTTTGMVGFRCAYDRPPATSSTLTTLSPEK